VKLVHRRAALRAENDLIEGMKKNGIEILFNTEVREIKGDDVLRSVVLYDNKNGESTEVEADGIFIEVGKVPNTEATRIAGVELNERGYIVVDARQRTNVEGVYTVGDVTICPHKQIGTAIGHAVIAAIEAYGYIRGPYYYRE
jgi:thioredoxin reductase